ncbi:predicted palmitoyltransferase [Pseudozyma hubeiensis SY62]|uniref:Palmitoyltransferase n=1 Tax=Pseudozyma hubeiensis (strain SY62) TaxID=1305764 RepID=R9PB34_PSEHS|nr:predicted palmitoyltransferase [Pseudozyma hubeiensis SY62]GAC98437.1 predicted palmitoyltransferase [Pseudozyma hubeiensis SY62]
MLADTSIYPSSRTFNSSSRLSHYTDAATRRSSFQSAQASIYQDTDTSLAYDDASEGFDHLDLDSDLEVRSQRAPSRSNTRSPFQSNIGNLSHSADGDAVETTIDGFSASSGNLGGMARRRSSYRRQSSEIPRPQSSLSRRSSTSGTVNEDPQIRLRDAATAAAMRSSMTRRHSVELDQLANSITRASTPHGFRSEDDEDDAAAISSQPRSRPGSSLALRKYEQDSESFIKRDGTKERGGSILPPAGFFAPKRPAARNSNSNLLATVASPQSGRSTTPLSFYSVGAAGGETQRGDAEEEVLQRSTSPTGLEGQGAAGQARAPSPWGVNSIASSSQQHLNTYPANGTGRRYSHTGDGTGPSHPLDPSDGFPTPSIQASPNSVLRMMASTDPLLPARAVPGAAVASAAINGSHAPSSQDVGLGLDTKKASPTVTEQRASPPAIKPPSSKQNGRAPLNASPPTSKSPRNYKHQKGSNHFPLCGLLITSSDNPLPFLLSLVLLLALGALFYAFEAPYLTTNVSPAITAVFTYIFLQAIVNMLVTAFRDPGILPRDLDPNPPCVLAETPFTPGRHALADPEDPMAIPVQRVLRIRGRVVQVKWCETCGTYRPPRSSHCRVCDNCVENIDHHCTYLNTCIGRRNYVSFMVFLTASIASALYVVGCSAARLVLMTRGRGVAGKMSFRDALGESPVSGVLFLLCLGVTAPLGVLLSYHVRLVLLNRSTVEQIRINTSRKYGGGREEEVVGLGEHGDDESILGEGKRKSGELVRRVAERFGVLKPRKGDPNPFAVKSWRSNVRNALGWRSVELESWIDRRGRRKKDERKPNPKKGSGVDGVGEAGTGLQWKA